MDVPEETVKLMNGLGFQQTHTIAPNVQWNNLKGLTVFHHYQEYPRNIDDVMVMIHTHGYNLGVHEQVEKYKHSINSLTDKFIDENRVLARIPRRADQNLLLQGLCAE